MYGKYFKTYIKYIYNQNTSIMATIVNLIYFNGLFVQTHHVKYLTQCEKKYF